MPDPDAALLKLPDELMIEGAKNVDVTSLHGLSLTCRRTRPIAQEALIQQAIVSPLNIWKLAKTLHVHPRPGAALTHIRFRPMTEKTSIAMANTSEIQSMQEDHKPCYRTIMDSYGKVNKAILDGGDLSDSDFSSAGMAILMALAPGVRSMTIGTNVIQALTVMEICLRNGGASRLSAIRDWFEQARSQLESRLSELIVIYEDAEVTSYQLSSGIYRQELVRPALYLSLSSYGQLKRLVVPYQKIGWQTSALSTSTSFEQSDPAQVLPQSLQFIRLIMDGRRLRVARFDKLFDPTVLPNILQVELQFSHNMLSSAWEISMSFVYRKEVLPGLQRWRALRASLITTFGNIKFTDAWTGVRRQRPSQHTAGDLTQAIEKCLATSHTEIEKDSEVLIALGYEARSA